MSLETVLEKIKEQKVIAQQDLDSVDRRVYPYKKGQVEAAKETLEKLYIDYKNELLKRSIFILVTGSESNKFADLANTKGKTFSLDAKVLFKDIVSELNPELYLNKTANAPLFDIVSNVLEKKMKNLDVMSYNSLVFNQKYLRNIKNKTDMEEVVKEAIIDIVGGEVVGLDALERITKTAVNNNYKSRIVPILLHNEDDRFISDISTTLRSLNPRVIRIVAGEVSTDINPFKTLTEIDEEKVVETLKEIASKA